METADAPALPALEIPEAEAVNAIVPFSPVELPQLPALPEGDVVDASWRYIEPELPALATASPDWQPLPDWPSQTIEAWQPADASAPQTMTNQLWQEYAGRGYRDHADNLPDVGQQIDAGLPSVSQVRSGLTHAGSAGRTAPRTGGFSLPDFDLFGGLFSGLAGLGLFLDGLIGLFSLSWLFGPSKASPVRLVLYAVPLELGVMAYNALTNKGVRATAVEYVSDAPGVMEEFFFNVPETQAEWTEYILRSIKLMWRRADG